MDTYELVRKNAEEIIKLGEKHGALNLRLFGSLVKGGYDELSDVDLLYTKAKTCTPWFPGGLKVDLEELLGKPVDLVSDKYVKDRFKEEILQEAFPLCELMLKD